MMRAPRGGSLSTPDGIWFVYRSHAEGPLSKRVRRLTAPSVLTWFQAQIEEARISAAPANVADGALGGPVYGFGALWAFFGTDRRTLHDRIADMLVIRVMKP